MSRAEFVAWGEFYAQQPFSDFHRFHRPAALVANAMGGGDIAKRLEWLQPKPVVKHPRYDEAAMRSLAAFGFKPPPR